VISDYYKSLIRRVITQVSDGAGGFTETTTDTLIRGFIAVLSGYEAIVSAQRGINASARLFTADTLTANDRIIDGTIEYEIVMLYDQFHKYYDLKRLR
jgi:hypothetical protein